MSFDPDFDIPCSMLPGDHARDACRLCGNVYGHLGCYYKLGGAKAVRWVCERCEDYKTAGDLPVSILKGFPIESLPTCEDRRGTESTLAEVYEECVRCGSVPTHQHHWAPQSLFPDWPPDLTVPLCQECHSELHNRLRAAGLILRRENG